MLQYTHYRASVVYCVEGDAGAARNVDPGSIFHFVLLLFHPMSSSGKYHISVNGSVKQEKDTHRGVNLYTASSARVFTSLITVQSR